MNARSGYDVRQDSRHVYWGFHQIFPVKIGHTVLDGNSLIISTLANGLNMLLIHVLGTFEHINIE